MLENDRKLQKIEDKAPKKRRRLPIGIEVIGGGADRESGTRIVIAVKIYYADDTFSTRAWLRRPKKGK